KRPQFAGCILLFIAYASAGGRAKPPLSRMGGSLLADPKPDPLSNPAHLALEPDICRGAPERVDLSLVLARARISLREGSVVVIEHLRVHAVLEALAAQVRTGGHASAQSVVAVRYGAQAAVDRGLGHGRSPLDGLARGGGRILALRISVRKFPGSVLRLLPKRWTGWGRGAASLGRRSAR